MTQFAQHEQEVKDNYIGLHRSTGESFESIARRLEENVGDAVTAAKVRALAKDYTTERQIDIDARERRAAEIKVAARSRRAAKKAEAELDAEDAAELAALETAAQGQAPAAVDPQQSR